MIRIFSTMISNLFTTCQYFHWENFKFYKANSSGEWTAVRDQWSGTYSYNGDEWIAFDHMDLIRNKIKYVHENKLYGVVLKYLEYDDPNNIGGHGKLPVLKEIHSILLPDWIHSTLPPTIHSTIPPTSILPTMEPPTTTTVISDQSTTISSTIVTATTTAPTPSTCRQCGVSRCE